MTSVSLEQPITVTGTPAAANDCICGLRSSRRTSSAIRSAAFGAAATPAIDVAACFTGKRRWATWVKNCRPLRSIGFDNGSPAGLIRMSRSTASGRSAAASTASAPPIECPASTTRRSVRSSSSSHAT